MVHAPIDAVFRPRQLAFGQEFKEVSGRHLLVTVDTEIDRDRHWRIADPVSFTSVTHGIPEILSPLFERHGVRPTYLLSPEVLEHAAAAEVVCAVERAELGTHLHPELIEPVRLVPIDKMAGSKRNTIQSQYPPDVERAKLFAITDLFRRTAGYSPKAFRAGRYGMSAHTLEFLTELGYVADSSVTPGLLWNYPEGRVDYRSWNDIPRIVWTAYGSIVELPITIAPSALVTAASALPIGSAILERAARAIRPHYWLRPSRRSGRELIRLAAIEERRFLVLMFHSTEVEAGRSPYAKEEKDVWRIVSAMDELFEWWGSEGNQFCTMSEAAALIGSGGGLGSPISRGGSRST